MKPHKWAKEIKAWADGAEIESRTWMEYEQAWTPWKVCANRESITVKFMEHKGMEYRVKPQSKEPQYLYVYEDIGGINITSDKNYATKDMEYIGKIKLETNDE